MSPDIDKHGGEGLREMLAAPTRVTERLRDTWKSSMESMVGLIAARSRLESAVAPAAPPIRYTAPPITWEVAHCRRARVVTPSTRRKAPSVPSLAIGARSTTSVSPPKT